MWFWNRMDEEEREYETRVARAKANPVVTPKQGVSVKGGPMIVWRQPTRSVTRSGVRAWQFLHGSYVLDGWKLKLRNYMPTASDPIVFS